MTFQIFLGFVIFLVLPMAYQRLKFFYWPQSFYKLKFREKIGLQIHHGHWGILFLFLATMLFLFGEKTWLLASIFGFGWGLLLDEIAPSVMMPSKDRDLELSIYSRSTKATLWIFFSVIVLVSVLYFL